MSGDTTGADVEGSENTTVGKRNVQQVVNVDDRQRGDTGDLWRAVQRVENKLDLALAEQSRLMQQDGNMAQQLALLAQQVATVAAQVTQLVSATAERDRRVGALEQTIVQRAPGTTSFDRLMVIALAVVMLALFGFNLWGMR